MFGTECFIRTELVKIVWTKYIYTYKTTNNGQAHLFLVGKKYKQQITEIK